MNATEYLNPFKLIGSVLSTTSKIVHDAPTDFISGWDSAWDETPTESAEPKPKPAPTPEQIAAKIAELQAMLPTEPANETK